MGGQKKYEFIVWLKQQPMEKSELCCIAEIKKDNLMSAR